MADLMLRSRSDANFNSAWCYATLLGTAFSPSKFVAPGASVLSSYLSACSLCRRHQFLTYPSPVRTDSANSRVRVTHNRSMDAEFHGPARAFFRSSQHWLGWHGRPF